MFSTRSERGQVLFLILIALAGLMGFAALVVDGGHLYSERRRAQSAADAAALAAASAGSKDKAESDILDIVGKQSNANGFVHDGANTVISYNHPPTSGPYSGNSEYYQVQITEHIAPIFAQFVFQGTQEVTVEAVARARPIAPLTGDNAMIALAECTCDGHHAITFDGNVKLTIRGGNIFSNHDGDKDGMAGDITVYASQDTDDPTLGQVLYYYNWDKTGPIHATFQKADQKISLDKVPEPYCPASDEYDPVNDVHYYVWNGSSMPSMPLQPGIHCVTGDINLQGTHKSLTGDGVLLVLKTGGIKTTGNAYVNLTRADDLIDKNGNQWGGMVIYSLKGNHSQWNFKGNSITTFNGTVLAPDAICDIGGNPENVDNHAAFICYNFFIHGDPTIRIDYNPKENWQWGPTLSQSQ